MIACPRGYVPYAVIKMSSDQCANDYCGEYGTCYIINSQLNLVSSCKCSGGLPINQSILIGLNN